MSLRRLTSGRAGPAGSVRAPVPLETFTDAERERLAPHFTDLDGPVFALVNLPETVKGALFARYSRYPGTLRRLLLDEFPNSLPAPPPAYYPGVGPPAARVRHPAFCGSWGRSGAQPRGGTGPRR